MDFVVRNTRRLAASWRRRQPAWPLDAGNRLIEALASAYFEPLIEARLDSFPDEEREAQRRRSHDDFRGWLAAEVGRVLTRFDKGGDGSASVRAVSGAEALLRHARDDCGLRSADYPAYTQELKTLFARPPALESPPKLADKSAERLPVLLTLGHFRAPSQQTVEALLEQEDDPAALWEALYSHKGQQFAQATLAGLLARFGTATQLPPPVTGWLGQEQWDDGDYLILYRATGMNPLVAEVVTGQGEMARQHLQVMEERRGEWSSRLWQEEGKSEDLLTGGLVDAEAALRELANIRFGTASALETARPVQDYKDLYLGTRYGLLSGATDTGTTSSKPWWSEVDLSEYILYALFPLLYVFFDVKWDLPEEASNWEQLLAKTLTLAYMLAPLVATALLVYWKRPWVLRLGAAALLLLVSAGSFLALRDWLQHPLTLWGQLGLGALVALMVSVVLFWSWTFEQKWRADVLDSVYRKL